MAKSAESNASPWPVIITILLGVVFFWGWEVLAIIAGIAGVSFALYIVYLYLTGKNTTQERESTPSRENNEKEEALPELSDKPCSYVNNTLTPDEIFDFEAPRLVEIMEESESIIRATKYKKTALTRFETISSCIEKLYDRLPPGKQLHITIFSRSLASVNDLYIIEEERRRWLDQHGYDFDGKKKRKGDI